jgi:hypothetical protein
MTIVAMTKITDQTLGQPQRWIGRQHHERSYPEKVAPKALEAVAAEEAPAVEEVMGAHEVQPGPNREDAEGERGEGDVDE